MSTPTEQLITILPDGSIQGLQVKPGAGLDLRDFGAAEITRASEISFDAGNQRWFIEIRTGKHRGQRIGLTFSEAVLVPNDGDFLDEVGAGVEVAGLVVKWGAEMNAELDAENRVEDGDDDTFYFERYDHAVGFEVDILNLMREADTHALTCGA